jgi:hypothetical protein
MRVRCLRLFNACPVRSLIASYPFPGCQGLVKLRMARNAEKNLRYSSQRRQRETGSRVYTTVSVCASDARCARCFATRPTDGWRAQQAATVATGLPVDRSCKAQMVSYQTRRRGLGRYQADALTSAAALDFCRVGPLPQWRCAQPVAHAASHPPIERTPGLVVVRRPVGVSGRKTAKFAVFLTKSS